MIAISKIRQYNFARLVYIVFYKILYKVYLRIFRLFAPNDWSVKKLDKVIMDELCPDYFYTLCDSNTDHIIKEANLILAGKIELFGSYYDIDSVHGWLTDPISKKEWPHNFYFVTAPVRWDGLGDVKYVLELNKFNHLVRVALAFYYTQEEKYIDYILSSIEGYRNTIKPYRSVCQRIIMDMGFRIINLIQVMMLCSRSERFESSCSPLINGIIYDQVNSIRRFHTAKWFKTGNGNNHVTGEMVGAIVGTLWLEHFTIKVRKRYRKYLNTLIKVLDRTIAPSGAYLEQSDNYTRVVAEFLVFFDFICDIISSKSLDLSDYKKNCYTGRLLQYLTNISYHDQLPNFGDNDEARVLIAWKPQVKNVDYLIKGYCRNKIDYLDGSSWIYRSEDKNDVYIYTRVGKFAFFKEATRIHSHNDLLSLSLGVKGQMVFVDKGCYLYNQGADILIDDRSYSSHNTASIDNLEIDTIQCNGSYLDYPSSKCILTDKAKSRCVFEGLLEYKNVKQIRKIEYSDNVICVTDRFEGNNISEKKGKIKYILHKDLKAELVNNVITVTCSTNVEFRLQIEFEGVESIMLEKVSYSPAFAQKEDTVAIVGIINIKNKEFKTKIEIN